MAQFVKNYVQDLAQDIQIRHCGTLIFNADSDSNVINVALYNGQEEAPQSGSVACAVICSDGSTVPVTGGTISGNTVSVTMGADGLIPGQVGIGIQVISGDVKTTVFKAVYSVELFETDTVVDPSSRITISVGELVQDIEDAVASIPSDYSDLLAAIAPNYADLTFPVKKGTFCWYSGTLYTAKQDIDTSESWTASHWVSSPLANELAGRVGDLKSAFDAVVESTDVWSDPVSQSAFTRLDNKNFTSANGIQDKTGWSILYWQADESGFYNIVFDYSNANNNVKIYTSDTFAPANFVKSATSISTTQKQVEVEAGQYIVTQAWSMTYTLSVTRKTGEEYSVPEIDEKIAAEEDNLFPTGWIHLPVENFSRNEWNGYNSTTSRNYRVKYNLPVSYNRPVTIMAAPGFYVSGYYSTGSSVGDGLTSVDLPANTLVKLFIRRINENSSEVADIAEFANALTISTPLAGIAKDRNTFTDVSMFERVGICGDSYAAGGGYISGVTALTWGKNLERQSGITVDIYAKSGEAIHTDTGWNYDTTNGLPALLAGEECGLYWMAHGINSYGSAAIGTPEDMSANPLPFTFYGQYVYAINAIKAKFPRARIVISTVTGTSYALWETMYAAVNTAIRNIAEFCGIPLIELIDDDFYKSNWYGSHHLSNHPSAMLCAGMAMANRRLLAKSIMDNDSYYIDYGNKYKTAISCPMVEGGSISATPSVAVNGETVTLSNTPLPGYHFVSYNSSDVTITNGTFVVPGSSGSAGHGTYTITGVFEAD